MAGKAQRLHICEECRAKPNPPPLNACAGCRKVKAKDWYRRNKGKYAAWVRQWRTNNPEALKESRRRWAKKFVTANPETKRAWEAAWKRANPERVREKNQRWRLNNRDRHLSQRKRAYSRKNYGEFWEAHQVTLNIQRELKG